MIDKNIVNLWIKLASLDEIHKEKSKRRLKGDELKFFSNWLPLVKYAPDYCFFNKLLD